MPRLRVFHWNEGEAAALLARLRGAGHTVDYEAAWSPEISRAVSAAPPDAFVIDLSRLPSHGREVATFFRGRKATRQIPIVFVGGIRRK